jgi:hypothetical protein
MSPAQEFPDEAAAFHKLVVQFGKDMAAIQQIEFKIAGIEGKLHGWLVPDCGGAEKLMTVETRVVWSLPREQEEIAFAA